MKFISFLKNTFLLFMILLFMAAGVFLQGSLVLKNTFFSEGYFNKTVVKNNMGENFVKLAKSAIDNGEKLAPLMNKEIGELDKNKSGEMSLEAQKLVDSYKTMMKQNIDMEWIRVETPQIMNSFYGYFLSGKGKLPVVNIKPVKEAYVNMIAQQIIMNSTGDTLKQTDKILAAVKGILKKYSGDGNVNDRVVDETMKLDIIKTMNISREAVSRIDNKIVHSESLKSEELLAYTVTEMIKDRVSFYEMKDELDLNLLYDTKYGNKYNPVSGAAEMIGTVRKSGFSMIFMWFILLFLIIAITAHKPKSILRWLGTGMLFSGILGLVSNGFAGFMNSEVISHFKGLNAEAKGLDMTFAQNWLQYYINGVRKDILIYASIFVIFGVLFITASFFIQHLNKLHLYKKILAHRGTQRVLDICRKKKTLVLSVRIATVIMLFIAIPVNTAINIKGIRASVQNYNEMREKTNLNAMDTNKALGKVLNAEKLMDMMK